MWKICLTVCLLLSGCGTAGDGGKKARPDPTKETWYLESVQKLGKMNAEAERLAQKGDYDGAAALVTEGQPLQSKVLSVPRPTLPATEAAADLDQLYASMLLRNKHYGWARLLFQKNVSRWKNWTPPTDDSTRRLKLAMAGIEECDRGMTK